MALDQQTQALLSYNADNPEVVRRIVRERGLTQEDVAQALNVTPEVAARYGGAAVGGRGMTQVGGSLESPMSLPLAPSNPPEMAPISVGGPAIGGPAVEPMAPAISGKPASIGPAPAAPMRGPAIGGPAVEPPMLKPAVSQSPEPPPMRSGPATISPAVKPINVAEPAIGGTMGGTGTGDAGLGTAGLGTRTKPTVPSQLAGPMAKPIAGLSSTRMPRGAGRAMGTTAVPEQAFRAGFNSVRGSRA